MKLRLYILTVFLTLLGYSICMGQEFSDVNGNSPQNKPILYKLTSQMIDTTSDENLLFLIIENLIGKVSEDYTHEYKEVMAWNQSRQVIYKIWLLESEVNNGGFNQFYFNPSGQFYDQVPEALKLAGAYKFASLAQNANDTYRKERKKIKKYQNGTMEGFKKSYSNNHLNEYDSKFYKLYEEEDLNKIQIDFIRKHKNDFIDL